MQDHKPDDSVTIIATREKPEPVKVEVYNPGLSFTRDEVVAAARTFIGTPYRHIGREGSMDCIGLPLMTAIKLGYPEELVRHKDFRDYERRPVNDRLEQAIKHYLLPITNIEADAGDIILMKEVEFGFFGQHLAIITLKKPLKIIHAEGLPPQRRKSFREYGEVVEHAYVRDYQMRPHSFWRYPGLIVE